jgi:hypothetical protein
LTVGGAATPLQMLDPAARCSGRQPVFFAGVSIEERQAVQLENSGN